MAAGNMTSRIHARAAVLAGYGSTPSEVEELLRYNHNAFDLERTQGQAFPLPDEAFVGVWTLYVAEIAKAHSFTAIYKWLPQLQFAVESGLSQKPEYIAATTRGQSTYPGPSATGIVLDAPERCTAMLYETAAGRLPVLVPSTRADFVTLIQAFTKKGEPASVPESMGAVIVGGYNNFHRIGLLRDAYLNDGQPVHTWNEEFQKIKPQKHLYQDRFVILSPGPYSGVPAERLGLAASEWNTLSRAIRLEHECAHYFTRRVFGSMQNHLLDELIADYCGLDKAMGAYVAEWALCFLGLEDAGAYREGGRLENYRGEPALSPGAFAVLGRLVRACVATLAQFNLARPGHRGTSAYRAAFLLSIGAFTLEELAHANSSRGLIERFDVCLESVLDRWGTAGASSLDRPSVMPASLDASTAMQ